jgi:carboxylesterase
MAVSSPLIMSRAEPFFFPGGPNGVLLIHGFTGTPFEMRAPAEYLASQGHTVLAIRLAGHATQPEDLARARMRDWLASVEDGLCLLKPSVERIFLMGLSLGGVLSLITAARFPLAGAITMSTPYQLSVPKSPPDWRNPHAAKDHVAYADTPTLAVIQVLEALALMRTSLPEVKIPVLLVHSKADQTALPESMPRIFAALGSADKHMLWVENSGHNIPREPDRQVVFAAAAQFIHRLSA